MRDDAETNPLPPVPFDSAQGTILNPHRSLSGVEGNEIEADFST